MKNTIKFGTDGWRGITGFDFTDEKVKLISAGICKYLDKNKASNVNSGKKPLVLIGYDTRFLSSKFAASAASLLNANGVDVILSDSFVTTPALSYAVVREKADLGIMITASHNPYYYNGYKIKGPYGGSATMDLITGIENEVNLIWHNRELKDYTDKETRGNADRSGIVTRNLKVDYKNYLLSLSDRELIKKRFSFPVITDPMYGAGQGIFREILSELGGSEIFEIHGNINASFGGINPEPIGDNLNEAISFLKEKSCSIAFCIDGDGDRIGAIGQNGNFISSHHIFAIILDYLVRVRNYRGKVIKTVSTSSIIDRICKKYDLELIVKPVGFKYIGEEILAGDVIMGGEESGGIWANGFIPERDGIRICLLLLEVICSENKSVNEILKDIYNLYGFFLYKRVDYEIENDKKEILRKVLGSRIPEILKSEGSSNPINIDGYKYFFPDGSWLMIRPSGTEAVVRVYAESNCSDKLDKLHEFGKRIIQNPDER
jgi:phosphomannomutase